MSYFLLSVPYEQDRKSELKKMQQKLSHVCDCFEFKIPALKVGTLDNMMSISDEMVKIDGQVEAVMSKILKTIQELAPRSDYVPQVTTPNRKEVVPQNYLQNFEWDEAKLPTRSPIKAQLDNLLGKVSDIEQKVKDSYSPYNQLKTSLDTIKRKETGSLAAKPLTDIIKKENSVESEYLTTVYVVVPSSDSKKFLQEYESFADYVVPDSAECIASDNDYKLFCVVVFRKTSQDFANQCKERKYIVRDFTFDESQVNENQQEREKLEEDIDEKRQETFRECTAGFDDVFFAWTHIKAIRLFVESVLRYGVPPQFCPVLIKMKKSENKVHKEITQLYKHLEVSPDAVIVGADNSKVDLDDMDTGEKYYPYVHIPLNMNHPGLVVNQ